ncbi:MAG: hypothetical protein V4654_08240 [Bdellovibrionota bacterium]
MKFLIFSLLFTLSVSNYAFAATPEVRNCKAGAETKLRMFKDIVSEGDLAVTSGGLPITTKDILTDQPIFFMNAAGVMTEGYQWMYNNLHPVEGFEGQKFLASSYGEDVIVSFMVDDFNVKNNKVSITYIGTISGNYLTLFCEK